MDHARIEPEIRSGGGHENGEQLFMDAPGIREDWTFLSLKVEFQRASGATFICPGSPCRGLRRCAVIGRSDVAFGDVWSGEDGLLREAGIHKSREWQVRMCWQRLFEVEGLGRGGGGGFEGSRDTLLVPPRGGAARTATLNSLW